LANEKDKTPKTKILLVEDEAITALALNRALENMGFLTCQPAATGRKALECFVREKPDVVLMDINLTGDMNGIETARRMQELGRTAVIFITGYSSEELLERARALNPAAIFIKPVSPPDLEKAIEAAARAGAEP
jgi:two-component system, response regulator PdtaR